MTDDKIVTQDVVDDSEEATSPYMVRGVSSLLRARLRALADLHHRPVAMLLGDMAELCEAMLPAKEAPTYENGLRARIASPRGGTVPIGSLPPLQPEQRQVLGLYQPIQETRLGQASQLGRLFRPTVVIDLVVLAHPASDFWIVVPHRTIDRDGALVFSADDAARLRRVVSDASVASLDAALFVRLHQPGGGPLSADHLRALDVWQQWAERVVGRPVGVDRRVPADLLEAHRLWLASGIAAYNEGEQGLLPPAFWETFWAASGGAS